MGGGSRLFKIRWHRPHRRKNWPTHKNREALSQLGFGGEWTGPPKGICIIAVNRRLDSNIGQSTLLWEHHHLANEGGTRVSA